MDLHLPTLVASSRSTTAILDLIHCSMASSSSYLAITSGLPAGARLLPQQRLVLGGTVCTVPFFREAMENVARGNDVDVIVARHDTYPELLNAVVWDAALRVSGHILMLTDLLLFVRGADDYWLVPSKSGLSLSFAPHGVHMSFDEPFSTWRSVALASARRRSALSKPLALGWGAEQMAIKKRPTPPNCDYEPIVGEVDDISFGIVGAVGDPPRRLEDVILKRAYPTERPVDLSGAWPPFTADPVAVLLSKGAPDHFSSIRYLCDAYHSKPGNQIEHLAAQITIRFPGVDDVPQRLRIHEARELGRGFAQRLASKLHAAAVFCWHVPAVSWGHGAPIATSSSLFDWC